MGKIDVKARDAKIKQYRKFSQEQSKSFYKGLKGLKLYVQLLKDKKIAMDVEGIVYPTETKKG